MYDRHESISKSTWDIDVEPATTTATSSPRISRSPSPTLTDQRQPIHRRAISHLNAEVGSKAFTYPSIYMCFLTGLTASPSFAACFIWCGFQTGNAAQLGLALARLFTPDHQRTFGFQKMDQQALVSLLSFFVGSSIGQLGYRIGPKKRNWLVGATFTQIVFMAVAALISHYSEETGLANSRGDPSWAKPMGMTALAFLSATMGLQGAVGLRLGTPAATTVPLTSTWIDIFNDPFLFALRAVRTRDIRCAGALSLIFGAFVSRGLIGVIGSSGTIGVVAAFRAILMAWWFFLPDAQPSLEEETKP
ncbi:uncharacterized protein I303_108581 [Kwoniella dejecticola CBS 10117]|uniref:DUF1275 domain protein n=1 Tax=Kwoniella dejecticola CBS 10117 TaxID=1296121 RepID=A0A1A5ZX02_9TREE|nr:uncharacterized protein I303_07093 [Kwoniella dejecticola CBS 10117]OBR82334.1 hypothetical protein I303_07093 [Kwoniella dejecticola CBS 10117]